MKRKALLIVWFPVVLFFLTLSFGFTKAFAQDSSQSAANNIDLLSDSDISQKYVNGDFITILKGMGYYKDEYSKDLDFRDAILRYQSWNNLVVDGKLDTLLKRMLLKGITKAQLDILPEDVPEGYWITVNKTKRILTIYKGRVVQRKCPVATGKLPSFTPEGKFKIVVKVINPAWGNHGKYVAGGAPNNPLGKRWMGLSPEGGNTYGIHGSNVPYSIGTDASAGCIRMINSEVAEVYEYIPAGTEVWIGTDEQLKGWNVIQLSDVELVEKQNHYIKNFTSVLNKKLPVFTAPLLKIIREYLHQDYP